MNNQKFYTKAGKLTVYAFNCGYIEQSDIDAKRVTLWLEHGTWHVRAHDFAEHKRLSWGTFQTLSEARKAYRLAMH